MYKNLELKMLGASKLLPSKSDGTKLHNNEKTQFTTLSKLHNKSTTLGSAFSYNTLNPSRKINKQIISSSTDKEQTAFNNSFDDGISKEQNMQTVVMGYSSPMLNQDIKTDSSIKYHKEENQMKLIDNNTIDENKKSYISDIKDKCGNSGNENSNQNDKFNKNITFDNFSPIGDLKNQTLSNKKMLKNGRNDNGNDFGRINRLKHNINQNLNDKYCSYTSYKPVNSITSTTNINTFDSLTLEFETADLNSKSHKYHIDSKTPLSYNSISNTIPTKDMNNKLNQYTTGNKVFDTRSLVEQNIIIEETLISYELDDYIDVADCFSDGYGDETTTDRNEKKCKINITVNKEDLNIRKRKIQSEFLKHELIFDVKDYEKYSNFSYTKEMDPKYLSRYNATFKKKSVCPKLSISGKQVVLLDMLNKTTVSNATIKSENFVSNVEVPFTAIELNKSKSLEQNINEINDKDNERLKLQKNSELVTEPCSYSSLIKTDRIDIGTKDNSKGINTFNNREIEAKYFNNEIGSITHLLENNEIYGYNTVANSEHIKGCNKTNKPLIDDFNMNSTITQYKPIKNIEVNDGDKLINKIRVVTDDIRDQTTLVVMNSTTHNPNAKPKVLNGSIKINQKTIQIKNFKCKSMENSKSTSFIKTFKNSKTIDVFFDPKGIISIVYDNTHKPCVDTALKRSDLLTIFDDKNTLNGIVCLKKDVKYHIDCFIVPL